MPHVPTFSLSAAWGDHRPRSLRDRENARAAQRRAVPRGTLWDLMCSPSQKRMSPLVMSPEVALPRLVPTVAPSPLMGSSRACHDVRSRAGLWAERIRVVTQPARRTWRAGAPSATMPRGGPQRLTGGYFQRRTIWRAHRRKTHTESPLSRETGIRANAKQFASAT